MYIRVAVVEGRERCIERGTLGSLAGVIKKLDSN